MKVGVQTFTIRKTQKKNIEKAYLPLINLGIVNFEVARIKFNKQNALIIKSLIDKYNINIVSIQVKPKYVFNHKDEIIEFAKIVNCKNVIISMLPFPCILGKEEKFYKFITLLDDAYDYYHNQGINLAYHHHNWEYVRLSNNKTKMEELLSKTKRIKFVLDTYWTVKSSYNVVNQIHEFNDRLLGVHLRDLRLYRKNLKVLSSDCEIGKGIINFKDVINNAIKVGCKYFVIEQKTNTPYESIKDSYTYLINNNLIER